MVNLKASSHIHLSICTCSLYQVYKMMLSTVYNLQTLVSRRLVLPDDSDDKKVLLDPKEIEFVQDVYIAIVYLLISTEL